MKKSRIVKFEFGEGGDLSNMTTEPNEKLSYISEVTMRVEEISRNPLILCVACEKDLASNRIIFNQKHGIAAPLCDDCLYILGRLLIKLPLLPLNTEPTIFKFNYYPTRGYACSHSGDNTGYYVNLNDYERLKEQIKKLQTRQSDSFPISAPWGEPLDYDLDFDECTCGMGSGTIAGEEHGEGCPMRKAN